LPNLCRGRAGPLPEHHRPAHDLATVEVHDGGQIEPSLIGPDIGDIGEPDPVRRGGGEVAVEQVRGGLCSVCWRAS
jgi:hypothetical protein